MGRSLENREASHVGNEEVRGTPGCQAILVRDLNTTTLLPLSPEAGTWTDYDGDSTYADYVCPTAETTSTTARYMPGIWEKQGTTLRAHHGDQIGSSRAMTSSSAAVVRRTVYTAFGERVLEDSGGGQGAMASSRYGYAGEWGYEQGLGAAEDDPADLGFIHVGERWYDPGSGRFLQRDPIGIEGGSNVFGYVDGDPLAAIDPTGTMHQWPYKNAPPWEIRAHNDYLRHILRPIRPARIPPIPPGAVGLGAVGVCGVVAAVAGITYLAADIIVEKRTGVSLHERVGISWAQSNPAFWGGNSWFAALFD